MRKWSKIISNTKSEEGKSIQNKLLFGSLSFLIPFVIIVLAYIALHISPFGEHMLLVSDSRALYASDLSFIARVLRGQEDVLYSLKSGIGMNLMGANSGLLNPANVIVLLFDITSWPAMYSWLMAIDLAFCGLTMFCFLSAVYGCKEKNLIFSTVYAMIGFNVAYCYHYNFILSPELLPLIALGIHRILRGKSPGLYIISLGYAIFASFYFGYMLCIASVVLFLFWYVRDKAQFTGVSKRRIWCNYIFGSLAAGLLFAFVWLPALLSFSGGRMNQNSILDFSFAENMSLADLGAKFFIGTSNINEQINGQPNVFVGSLVLFLLIAFFVDRRNTGRKRLLYAAPLIFYLVSFYIRAFSMVLQGFSATNWFNYRYSFVLSFIIIMVAYEEFAQLRDINTADLRKACVVFLALTVLIFMQRYSFVNGGEMILGLVFLAASIGVIWWNRIDPLRAPASLLIIMLTLLCSIEAYANYVICTNNLLEWEVAPSEYQEDLFVDSTYSEAVQQADATVFRMENEHATVFRAANDPRLFGYNGLTYFGSCERDFVYKGLSRLGMSWYANRMWYSEGKPSVFDSLLGVKYVISERNLSEEKGYERLLEMNGHLLYRNSYALPIAIIAARDDADLTLGLNPFDNQNALWKSMTGDNRDIFDQQKQISFTYHVGNDGAVVNYDEAKAYSMSLLGQELSSVSSVQSDIAEEGDNTSVKDVNATRFGNHIECTFVAEHDGPIYGYTGLMVDDKYGYYGEAMYYIGTFHKGDMVTDYIPVNGSVSEELLNLLCAEYYVAYPNQELLAEYSANIQNASGILEKLKDSHLVGQVMVEEDSRIFFTIPYDEGWTLTVDGRKTPLALTAGIFMSAPLSAGEHSYELRFFPKGMQTGIYISCFALVLLFGIAVYNLVDRKRHAYSNSSEEAHV